MLNAVSFATPPTLATANRPAYGFKLTLESVPLTLSHPSVDELTGAIVGHPHENTALLAGVFENTQADQDFLQGLLAKQTQLEGSRTDDAFRTLVPEHHAANVAGILGDEDTLTSTLQEATEALANPAKTVHGLFNKDTMRLMALAITEQVAEGKHQVVSRLAKLTPFDKMTELVMGRSQSPEATQVIVGVPTPSDNPAIAKVVQRIGLQSLAEDELAPTLPQGLSPMAVSTEALQGHISQTLKPTNPNPENPALFAPAEDRDTSFDLGALNAFAKDLRYSLPQAITPVEAPVA